VFGSVTHFTDMPVVHLPISPLDDLRVDEDDLTAAAVGVCLLIELQRKELGSASFVRSFGD
jgi:hypothetical protein